MTSSIVYNQKLLSYNITGQGTPVVLLHGYLETKELWDNISKELSKQYLVICPDLPGQGDSEPLLGQTVETMAESIYGLLESLKIEKANVFGHSMGGYITLAFAELFPDKVDKFGLLHSHPFPDSPEKKEQRIQEISLVNRGRREFIIKFAIPGYFATGYAEENPEKLDRALELALKTTDSGMIACINAMRNRKNRLYVLQDSKVISLWIAGRKDEFLPCSTAIETARELKNTKFYILENSGHVGMVEEFEKTVKILNQFLQNN